MSIEKDIAEVIVKKVASTTVADYLLPDQVSRDFLEDVGITQDQYRRVRGRLESRLSGIFSSLNRGGI